MKSYIQGLITGILLTASAMMFMGATNNDSENGRYRFSFQQYHLTSMIGLDTPAWRNDYFWVDTKLGEVYKYTEFFGVPNESEFFAGGFEKFKSVVLKNAE